MSLASSAGAARYDGRAGDELAAILALPRVVVFDEVTSTLDIAHGQGEAGAPAGTLVLADAQTAGRGRMRRAWRSDPGAGIWLTLLERPASDEALGVLALRIALALAPALDLFTVSPTQLKWPNDVYVDGRKLAGVLVEARWRGARLDWLALGVGINVRAPKDLDVAGLRPGSDRVQALSAIVPALRVAAAKPGLLDRDEIAQFAARDLAVGQHCVAPAKGIVAGIAPDGALLVNGKDGATSVYAGSLVLDSEVHSLGGSA
ncbi:MAG TPA: biotin--[acetyl-CoA-carboxylase] ligase [Gemmatimonadaceae bacterium]|nr:biotin--[acetyl-CoA-carboxylase] ligase [Gemmatimonadaceae bacterium]